MPGGDREAYGEVAGSSRRSPRRSTAPLLRVRRRGRRRPLREDGPQRHRVRRHAAHRRGLRPAAPRAGLERAGDLRRLRGVEPGRARVLPHRDHRPVLTARDAGDGKPLVDVILDTAEQKGTGRWTSQDALELGVPLTAHHRGRLRPHALGAARPARGRRARARRTEPRRGSADATRSSTTSAQRCTPRRSSRTPRASSRWRPRASTTAGTRPRRDGHDLARRLHHPRAVPRPHQRGLRRAPDLRTC